MSSGARTGDPGMMILCETFNNSKGSGAATPDRAAALSQNGYGQGRAGKIRRGGRGKAIPGQGSLAKDSWPGTRAEFFAELQAAPNSCPRFSARAKILAEFLWAHQILR